MLCYFENKKMGFTPNLASKHIFSQKDVAFDLDVAQIKNRHKLYELKLETVKMIMPSHNNS
jgi:hypothetical protein